MQAWFRQGLQPLYSAVPVIASSDPQEARTGTSGELTEHDLIWREGPVDCALRRLNVGELSFFLLRYGAAVSIAPGELQRFLLFQVPMTGSSRIQVGQHSLLADQAKGALISPTLPLRLDWDRHCEQLLLKIPRERIEQTCRDLLGSDLDGPVEFHPEFSLDDAAGRAWQHQISILLSFLEHAAPMALSQTWLRAQEEALIHHLLLCQRHTYTDRLLRNPVGVRRNARAAVDYIRQHLQENITLGHIARAGGCSVRSISQAFREQFNQSPMEYLRNARLEAARNDLLTASAGARVTDIALRWGFGHLGRFCGLYRQRYGESPLESLQR